MGVIVVALVGAIMLAVPGSPIHRKPTLGLDLQGGLEVVLKAVPPKGHMLTPDDIDRSISIMQNRINKLGVSEPEIRKQGKDQIVIQLAGVHDPAAGGAADRQDRPAELFDFETDLAGPSIDANGNPVATPSLYDAAHAGADAGDEGHARGVLPLPREDEGRRRRRSQEGARKPTKTAKHSLVTARRSTRESC